MFPGHSVESRGMLNLAANPLLVKLAGAKRIMICGCGGGHDLYTGLPLYFYLKRRCESVFLGNMTFAALGQKSGRRLTPAVTCIDSDTEGSDDFFPERVLVRWLRSKGTEASVFCFQRTGVVTLSEAWRAVQQELRLDAIILADGGTDSLMRGDEEGLGTPQEDLANIAAVHALSVPIKILSCLGFGVDRFDEVCHAHFLESVAALQRKGAFLGAFSLLPDMEEAKLFVEAVDDCVKAMPGAPSVVANSIAHAIEGQFGNVHRTWRTEGNKLFISALMSMYWSFEVDAVAKRCLYLPELQQTVGYLDVERVIKEFRKQYPPTRPFTPIPY